jgi:TRAP-type transport system periplasmic protein
VTRLAAAVTLSLAAVTARAADTVSLQAAHVYSEDHAWHRGLEDMAESLRTSNSGIELVVHPRGTWGGESDYIHSLRHGLLDVAVVPPSVAASVARNLAFLDLMFLWRDREHWSAVVDGPVGDRIAEMIETGTGQGGIPGLKVLAFWGGSSRHLFSRKRTYETLTDLAGLRIGVQDNDMNVEVWRAAGLQPVAVPLRNSIALVEADIVESVEAELQNAVALKLGGVAPHVTLTGHALTLRPLVISEATWRKLKPEQQKAVSQAAAAATRNVRALELRRDEESRAALKAAGATLVEFRERPQLRARSEELRQRLADEAGMSRLLKAIEEETPGNTR